MKDMAVRVKKLMEEYSVLRDDKQSLLAAFWTQEVNPRWSVGEFLHQMADGKISPPESILRAWRGVLEACPELRGPLYKRRKKQAEEFPERIKEAIE